MIQQDTHAHPLALVSVASLEDTTLLTQWEAHLRPLEQAGFISVWSALHLAPGTDCMQELQRQIDHADIVMVLLSADFFSSSECLAMRDRALERAHEGTTRVIPLLLRPVAWQESSLSAFVPWPPNGKPIVLWGDQDEGWHACVQELRRLLGRRVSEALRSNILSSRQILTGTVCCAACNGHTRNSSISPYMASPAIDWFVWGDSRRAESHKAVI